MQICDLSKSCARRQTAKAEKEKKIFNNASQVWNHDFYWRSLAPSPTRPEGKLAQAIGRDFGGLDQLLKQFSQAGTEQFGSGWAWLVSKAGKLSIHKTGNALDPMAQHINCVLTVDVWEHAYYLDYQNQRAKIPRGSPRQAELAFCRRKPGPRKRAGSGSCLK
jgi:superoxide dismutase